MARIGIDCDGVCYRFVDVLRDYIHEQTGKPYNEMAPARVWDFFESQWDFTPQQYLDFVVQGVKDTRIFWRGPLYENCKETLEILKYQLGHEIVFITARNFKGIEKECQYATRYWIESNGLPFDEIIVDNNKTGYGLDVLFDDSPNQIENSVLHGEKAVVFDQPWNWTIPPYADRVYGWRGLLEYVESKFQNNPEKVGVLG